jgi:hypothetical protein
MQAVHGHLLHSGADWVLVVVVLVVALIVAVTEAPAALQTSQKKHCKRVSTRRKRRQ